MSQFLIIFFYRIQRVSLTPVQLFFLINETPTFGFTKLIRPGYDNIYVTEKQNTMTEEEYFDRLIAERERYVGDYYDALEDRYEGDEWDYDGFFHY